MITRNIYIYIEKGGRTGLTNRLPLGLPKGGQRRKGGAAE